MKYYPHLYFLAPQDTGREPRERERKREREREREREIGFGSSTSIDGGVTNGKDGRGHGSVDPAYADLGRSGV